MEESYGYLSGLHARDKDAVVASLLVCEMAAYYKSQGKTLAEKMTEIYENTATTRTFFSTSRSRARAEWRRWALS